MRRRILFATFGIIGLLAAEPAAARNVKRWNSASNIGRDALAAVALGLPAVKRDWRGLTQSGESIGVAVLIAEGLKETFPERRPDGSDNKSFPSGHTSTAFAAAATLQNRYGWRVGLPAQAVAAFVGLARVEARKHHWYDVVAGAAIGEGSGFLLTSRRNERVRVLPWGDTKSAGFTIGRTF